jgi:hypothetical protein
LGAVVADADGTVAGVKRGFWAHQIVEYLLAVGAIATGAHTPNPALPCIAGGLVLLNAASTEGPLSAFKLIPRSLHRILDMVLVGAMLVASVAAGHLVDTTGRVLLIGLGLVLAFISWNTDYSKRAKRTKVARDSEDIGRLAGRISGNAVNMWRARKSR